MSREYDDSAASARAATRTTPVLFYLQAIMDYIQKEGRRQRRREGGRQQNRQLCCVSGDRWAALLFQPVSLFWPAPARFT